MDDNEGGVKKWHFSNIRAASEVTRMAAKAEFWGQFAGNYYNMLSINTNVYDETGLYTISDMAKILEMSGHDSPAIRMVKRRWPW